MPAIDLGASLALGLAQRGLVVPLTPLGASPNLLTSANPSDFIGGHTNAPTYGGGLTLVNGQLVLAVGLDYEIWGRPFTTVIGTAYTVYGRIVSHSGSPTAYGIRLDSTADASANPVNIGVNADGSYSLQFTATATTTYLILQVNSVGASATFDSLRVTQP